MMKIIWNLNILFVALVVVTSGCGRGKQTAQETEEQVLGASEVKALYGDDLPEGHYLYAGTEVDSEENPENVYYQLEEVEESGARGARLAPPTRPVPLRVPIAFSSPFGRAWCVYHWHPHCYR